MADPKLSRNKVRQPYLKYDSILIAPGAKELDGGYFDNWQSFGRASNLRWFIDRQGAIPSWASSQQTDRSDWAFEVHQAGIEFWAPLADVRTNQQVTDNFMTEIFTVQLPGQMDFEFKIADTDTLLKIPGAHAPAGVGPSGIVYASQPSGIVSGAVNGQPLVTNSWKFPDPLRISTRTTITVTSRVEAPLNALFTELQGPGFKVLPTGLAAGSFVFTPNFYFIRVWLRGARYIENIGARG